MSLKTFLLLSLFLGLTACGSFEKKTDSTAQALNSYNQVNLVANRKEYNPEILEPEMQNAWGIAIRPAGAGGHFWVTATATGTSIQYVGDVAGKKLFQDDIKIMRTWEKKGKLSTPTGVVFNPGKKFLIKQTSKTGSFEAESKFIFVSDSGMIFGWSEKKNADGSFNRPEDAVLVVNNHKRGDMYFGVGMDSTGEKMFVADFGPQNQIRVFDSKFKEVKSKEEIFKNPFLKPGQKHAGGEDYAPWNVQVLNVDGMDRVFVAYAKIEKEKNKVDFGEEVKGPGFGRLAEFDVTGKLIRVWVDNGLLNAPWGFAWAPKEGFGRFSNHLLVSNFGDGTITVLDPKTFTAIDQLRKSDNSVISIEGLWGLQFGNGVHLGEATHLYFAAGPKDETDGIFGKIHLNFNQYK